MKFDPRRKPILPTIEEEGAKLHNPQVRGLIRKYFGPFVSHVLKTRTALYDKATVSEKTFRNEFPELKEISDAEARVLFQSREGGERETAISRRIAAQLFGSRLGLDASTVLKYAQPARPRAKIAKGK